MNTFNLMACLPVYGPLATPFPADWGCLGREGTVVEFHPASGETWTGSFATGLAGITTAMEHPDGRHILVLSQGDLWVVDPETRAAQEVSNGIEAFWLVQHPDGFVLNTDGLAFLRLDAEGIRWHTRRISWDGFDNLKLNQEQITGSAWNAVDSQWQPFSVSLATGQLTGACYFLTDSWEQLAPSAS